jgi:hypothetical protein
LQGSDKTQQSNPSKHVLEQAYIVFLWIDKLFMFRLSWPPNML